MSADRELLELAREAGALFNEDHGTPLAQEKARQRLLAFAALVAAKEREACAQVCDAEFWLATKRDGAAAGVAAGNCAADIRDRGQ